MAGNLLFSGHKENKMKKLLVALLFCFATFYGGSLKAAIIDHDKYLTDTNTGLDWLDVTFTVNEPRFLVERDLWVGGIYEGWRFASGVEFNKLVSNYTQIPVSSYGIVYHTEGSIDGLVQLLGSTLDSGYNLIRGHTYDTELGVAEGEGVDYTYGFLADKATVEISGGLVDYYYVAMLADVDGRWIWGGSSLNQRRITRARMMLCIHVRQVLHISEVTWSGKLQ